MINLETQFLASVTEANTSDGVFSKFLQAPVAKCETLVSMDHVPIYSQHKYWTVTIYAYCLC